jgi:hypothetical protein
LYYPPFFYTPGQRLLMLLPAAGLSSRGDRQHPGCRLTELEDEQWTTDQWPSFHCERHRRVWYW